MVARRQIVAIRAVVGHLFTGLDPVTEGPQSTLGGLEHGMRVVEARDGVAGAGEIALV